MKTFKWVICLLAIVFSCCAITSCSSDDDPGDTSMVEGTWTGDEYDHFYSNVRLNFRSDGTGSGSIDHSGAYHVAYRMEFTYKVKGNKVTTKGKRVGANSDGETTTSDFDITLELSGNKLYVKKADSWFSHAVTSYRK